MTWPALKRALHEYANTQVAKLRGSVGTSAVYASWMQYLPQMAACADFIIRCRVLSASVALHAGSVPMVRVKLRAGRRTRTVTPSRWMQDLIGAFGNPSIEDFAPELRKILPKDRLQALEIDITNAKAAALADQNIMNGVHGRLAKKRAVERERQLKIIAQTLSQVPHDLLTEEDLIRIWRERQVKHVLET